jgi:N-acetylneuraminic acid mutarotase
MKSQWSVLLPLLVLLAACTQVEEAPMTDWQQHGSFPGSARASASAFVVGDSAYLCCGRTLHRGGFLNEVWRYDSQNDRWDPLDTFPGKKRVKAVAVAINGKGYVGMGCKGVPFENGVYKDFYEFDPTTRQWTRKADFPGEGANDLAYAVVNGCLYTSLGFDGILAHYETYRYDPTTNVWTQLKDGLHPYMLTASFALDRYFYIAAGFQGRNVRYMFRFDTASNQWSQAASLPDGRILSNGLAIDGKGYVLLGRFWAGAENGGRLLSDIVEYDPASNTWTKRGDLPGAARQNAAVFTIRGRGYVVMGESDTQCLSDVWSFKP